MNPQPPPIQDRKLAASTHLTNTINTPATPLYKENNTPGRLLDVLDAHVQLFTPPATPLPTSNRPALSTSTPASSNSKQTKKLYRGKYEATPRPPPYVPYALKSHGYARREVYAFGDTVVLPPLTALSVEQWNSIAHEKHLLPHHLELRPRWVEGTVHSKCCVKKIQILLQVILCTLKRHSVLLCTLKASSYTPWLHFQPNTAPGGQKRDWRDASYR
uniref:Uncharacterized protein n=1 Tax=Moniliophthora roreri TaxID=221103 RepID=A0A0W0FQ30_MONRR